MNEFCTSGGLKHDTQCGALHWQSKKKKRKYTFTLITTTTQRHKPVTRNLYHNCTTELAVLLIASLIA